MDLQMPHMNGFDASIEILKLMKDYGKEDQCRIVALSSYTHIDCINKCLNIGMVEYANKPINSNHLKAIVEKHHFREVALMSN
jgi:CheY-like chemotaxis protein